MSASEGNSPYKGFRPFQETDSADFFGRDSLVRRLIARLQEPESTFLAVVGPSGSGKSSLINAGLIPALRSGVLPGSEHWTIIYTSPTSRPLTELVADITTSRLAGDLFIYLDQFEEIFAPQISDAERKQFLETLTESSESADHRLHIVVTLRSDYYDRFQAFSIFPLLRKRTEFVTPFTPEELERVVVGPAQRIGLVVEPNLVSALTTEFGEEAAALGWLQTTLGELYRQRQGSTLTLVAYRAGGGISGVIARAAEETFVRLPPESQEATRQLFLRLVTLSDSATVLRRKTPRAELVALEGRGTSLRTAVGEYSKTHLLTYDRDPAGGQPAIQLVHDGLIRNWARLREWIDARRDDIRLLQRLTRDAEEWTRGERDPTYLASDVRLEQYQFWRENSDLALNTTEIAFLAASVAERESKRQRDRLRKDYTEQIERRSQRVTTLLIGLVAALILMIVAIVLILVNHRTPAATPTALVAIVTATANPPTATYPPTFTPLPTLTSYPTLIPTVLPTPTPAVSWTATPLVVTSVVTQQVVIDNSESLRLAAQANRLLEGPGANAELAELLAIRSLNLSYTAEGDAALVKAMELNYTQRIIQNPSTQRPATVAFSNDGKYILSTTVIAQVVNAQSGAEVHHFSGNVAAFAPTSQQIAVGSTGLLKLYDISTGNELLSFAGLDPTARFRDITFSPGGKLLAAIQDAAPDTLTIWDAGTGAKLHQYQTRAQFPHVVFSPDGLDVLVPGDDGTAYIVNPDTGSLIRSFPASTLALYAATYSPDGKQIVTAGEDKIARLWDVKSGQPIRQFVGHDGPIYSAVFSRSGNKILTTAEDDTSRLWDPATGGELRTFTGQTGGAISGAFSPDGQLAITGGRNGNVRVWDARTNVEFRNITDPSARFLAVVFSPDGKQFLSYADDESEGGLNTWDIMGNSLLTLTNPMESSVSAAVYSPDGKQIAALTGQTETVWNTQSGDIDFRFQLPTTPAAFARTYYSPDGSTLYTVQDLTLFSYNARTGALAGIMTGKLPAMRLMALSPDGKYIAIAVNNPVGQIDILDAKNGSLVRVVTTQKNILNSVSFSYDGQYILTTALKDQTAQMISVATGALVRTFAGSVGEVDNSIFSPDGKYVLTGGADKIPRLWDAATGVQLRQLIGHTGTIWGLAFSPDGKIVVTSSESSHIRIWDTDYRDTLRRACQHVQRDFTADERNQYGILDSAAIC